MVPDESNPRFFVDVFGKPNYFETFWCPHAYLWWFGDSFFSYICFHGSLAVDGFWLGPGSGSGFHHMKSGVAHCGAGLLRQ